MCNSDIKQFFHITPLNVSIVSLCNKEVFLGVIDEWGLTPTPQFVVILSQCRKTHSQYLISYDVRSGKAADCHSETISDQ